ncbi:MAG: hypothetical protein ACTSXE_00175 [Candidatus Thorarchaeota archaeon]
MSNTMVKPVMYSFTSVVIAVILLVSSLAIGSFNPFVGNLPGASLNGSPFEDISTDNLTLMESFMYPANYEVISERPYIIRVDYTNAHSVSEIQAELAAQEFINKVFSNQSIQQLEIDRRVTKLSTVLPRWRIGFKNNTYSDGIHIGATVTVNAITGGITGYIGSPIMCQGEAANQSIAENYATTALKELGYRIPVNLRMFYLNWTDPSKEDDITHRFVFQQVVNNTMIYTEIGSISIEIDGITGGIEYLSYKWIQVDEIPTEGIVSVDILGDDAVLTLARVSEGDYNEIGPQEFRLCWVKEDLKSGRTTVFDAFTGDVVYLMDSFGAQQSEDEVRMSFLIPLLISVIPATLLYFGAKRVLQRKFEL